MLKVGDRVMIKIITIEDTSIKDGMRGTVANVLRTLIMVKVDGMDSHIFPYKQNVVPLHQPCPMNLGETI